jgi:hypothetical protein
MKSLNIKLPEWLPVKSNIEYCLWGLIMALLWASAPKLFPLPNGNSEEMVTSIGLMVLLSLISFLLVLGLCWWLLKRFWIIADLPALGTMVLQFKTLELWEQLKFSFALFALLLLAGVGCLMAMV